MVKFYISSFCNLKSRFDQKKSELVEFVRRRDSLAISDKLTIRVKSYLTG